MVHVTIVRAAWCRRSHMYLNKGNGNGAELLDNRTAERLSVVGVALVDGLACLTMQCSKPVASKS